MRSDFDESVDAIRSGTHAVIDLDAYSQNVAVLRSSVADDVALMAVVKADGYGHGAVECGRAAIEAGAEMLGVARVREALYLRRCGIEAPIVVIGPPATGEIRHALERDITLTVGAEIAIEAIVAHASAAHPAQVHLKVDTGMHRYGFRPSEVADVAQRLGDVEGVTVEGVYTHFSSADETDQAPTEAQIESFWSAVASLDARGLRPRYVHMGNSAAILTGAVEGTNLVRSGIATYGLSPSDEVPVDGRFQPALSIRSRVTRASQLLPDEGVSYGLSYRASEPERIAALPIGYADGLPRQLANQGWYVVRGERSPIRGRVCMDQTVVGVSSDVVEGDEVLIYGPGASGEMTLEDIARISGTNNYEIATRVMARVPRIYLRDGQAVAWESVLSGERGRRSESA